MPKIIITLAISAVLITAYFVKNDISLIESHTQLTPVKSLTADAVAPANHLKNIATQTVAPAKPTPQAPKSEARSIADTIARFKANQDRTQLKDSLINDHENFKRYPEGNAAIADAKRDPILQRYEVDERTTMNEDKSAGLTIWSDKKFYLKDDTVNIYGFVQNNEGIKLSTQFDAQLLGTQGQPIKKLTFTENTNYTYQTSIALSEFSPSQLNSGIYKVLINNAAHNITDAITFTLTQPDIELTGEYKEHIDSNGELIIEAQVLAASASQFYIQGSLYSSTQVPIGVTQSSTQLDPGLHWLPLKFAGLMIKDAGESGPYVLKNVSLAKVTIPMMRTPLLQPGFTTDSYALDEFKL